MPRHKQYNNRQVIEKAMNLFWINGYQATSMQMLEKEMGINKFSIYSSFGSKDGIFLESLKCYKVKINQIVFKLEQHNASLATIKDYFHDFVQFSNENGCRKGCLITNTVNEIHKNADNEIAQTLLNFTNYLRSLFLRILQNNSGFSKEIANQKADYLIIALFGLSNASKFFNQSQLYNYINHVFFNL